MTSKENGNWKLTLFISKVVLKLIWFDFRNPKRVHSKWFENEVRMFHLFSKILKIPCLKQISKEPKLICLLFISAFGHNLNELMTIEIERSAFEVGDTWHTSRDRMLGSSIRSIWPACPIAPFFSGLWSQRLYFVGASI